MEELQNLNQLIWNNQYGIVGNHYPIHGDPLNPISRSKENENPQYASYFFSLLFCLYMCRYLTLCGEPCIYETQSSPCQTFVTSSSFSQEKRLVGCYSLVGAKSGVGMTFPYN